MIFNHEPGSTPGYSVTFFTSALLDAAWKNKLLPQDLITFTESLLNPAFNLSDGERESLKKSLSILKQSRGEDNNDARRWSSASMAPLIDFFDTRGNVVIPESSPKFPSILSMGQSISGFSWFLPSYPLFSFAGTHWRFATGILSPVIHSDFKELHDKIHSREDLLRNLPKRSFFHSAMLDLGLLLHSFSDDSSKLCRQFERAKKEFNPQRDSFNQAFEMLVKRATTYVELARSYEEELHLKGEEATGENLEILTQINRISRVIPHRRLHAIADNLYTVWVDGSFHSEREFRLVPHAYREAMRTGMIKDFHYYLSLIEDSLTSPESELIFQETISKTNARRRMTSTSDTTSGLFFMNDALRSELVAVQRAKLAELHNEAFVSLLLQQ